MFDGITTEGWKSSGSSKWEVSAEILTSPFKNPTPILTSSSFSDFEMGLEYKLAPHGAADIRVRIPQGSSLTASDCYSFKASNPLDKESEWTRVTIRAQGATISAFSLNSLNSIANHSKQGYGAIGIFPVKGRVAIRNMKLRPLGMVPIVTGKSLTGWTLLPAGKSAFSVMPDGILNGVTSPGRLQTSVAGDNFVIQLEAMAKSAHASGGVRLWDTLDSLEAGVEVHINNDTNGIDRTKPTTFGTGGIWRQVPTREVIPTDSEWFTMLIVVSNNRHIDVWINGYLTAGYTKSTELIAQESRSPAGKNRHISLAVYGPGSNIQFRNIKGSKPLEKRDHSL